MYSASCCHALSQRLSFYRSNNLLHISWSLQSFFYSTRLETNWIFLKPTNQFFAMLWTNVRHVAWSFCVIIKPCNDIVQVERVDTWMGCKEIDFFNFRLNTISHSLVLGYDSTCLCLLPHTRARTHIHLHRPTHAHTSPALAVFQSQPRLKIKRLVIDWRPLNGDYKSLQSYTYTKIWRPK